MEFATGALGTLLPKLAQLLQDEYKLQKNVRKNIKFLAKELETTQAALRAVGKVPMEQRTELVRIWARDARELSYDMEDVVDAFLVRVQGPDPPSRRSSSKFIQKMKSMLAVGKRHQIGEQIKDIKERVEELAARRDRYKVDTISPQATTLDPRITNLYTKATDLVGINKAKEELVTKLTKGDDMSMQQDSIVSIFGFGGLGKTTLAKAVYEEIKSQFHCTAFVSVSRNPDMKKLLKDILYELDRSVYGDIHNRSFDEKQLIDIARGFLHDKRYLTVIDDIWNISDWVMIIKYALPENNNGCRIIITTRKVTVARHIGCAYEMQPLSLDNSKLLLYRRIFGNEDQEKCHDEELEEVSCRILKKCAGVPLAIITIASLVAGRRRKKTEWDEVYNSIGNGMENSLDAENMRKILSYSYYDLPSYLKTCLLYLCTFPEDFEIQKYRLICLWIAEGFIQHEKQSTKSVFELGDSYFNELVNRSMVQPMYSWGVVGSCRVHDMVLDLIHSISIEENFVTVISNMDRKSPSTMARRLSLQYDRTDGSITQASRSMPPIRSIVAFLSVLDDQMLALESFNVLRVLDLQGCDLSQGYNVRYLGCLFHLRYLNLNDTRIVQLPEAVGKLQFLEILHVWNGEMGQLPECVSQLTRLLCLAVSSRTRVPNGIGSLTSLEVLDTLYIDDESTDVIEGLGLLTELRELYINVCTHKWSDHLVKSLCKLQKIHTLRITTEDRRVLRALDAWVPPPQLRVLYTRRWCWFSVLPAWMNNPTQFQDLVELDIAVRELQQEDLEMLGWLPALRYLHLEVDHKVPGITERRFVVGAGLFPCLASIELRGFLCPLTFQQGAIPSLKCLEFEFHVREVRDIAGSDGVIDLGLGNLLSLHRIRVSLIKVGASEEEVKEARAAVRHAAEIHPNLPRLIRGWSAIIDG